MPPALGSPPVSPTKTPRSQEAKHESQHQQPEPAPEQPAGEAERETMKEYWTEHSTACSVQEMMLDDGAEKIEQADREEILSLLPAHLEGKRVLELAAGVYRMNPRSRTSPENPSRLAKSATMSREIRLEQPETPASVFGCSINIVLRQIF